MQASGEAHDTPLSALETEPTPSGIGRVDQLAPRQRAAASVPAGEVGVAPSLPTAMHALAPAHDTPVSNGLTAITDFRQRLPFQVALLTPPTATHATRDAHDTENSREVFV